MPANDPEKVTYLLGQFAIALSGLDLVLPQVLAVVTGIEGHVAIEIYHSLGSVSARRKLVDAAARSALSDPEELKKYKALSDRHADLFSHRNRYMHDLWVMDGASGELHLGKAKLPKTLKDLDLKKVEIVDLERDIEQASTLRLDIVKFAFELAERRKPRETS